MAATEMPTSTVEQMNADTLMVVETLGFGMIVVVRKDGLKMPYRRLSYTNDQATVFKYALSAKDHRRGLVTNHFTLQRRQALPSATAAQPNIHIDTYRWCGHSAFVAAMTLFALQWTSRAHPRKIILLRIFGRAQPIASSCCHVSLMSLSAVSHFEVRNRNPNLTPCWRHVSSR